MEADKVMAVRSPQSRIGECMPHRSCAIAHNTLRLDWWVQRNSCSNKVEEVLNDGKVRHYSWTCGGTEGFLQHYKVEDLGVSDQFISILKTNILVGHCWADTEPNLSQISVPQLPTIIRASEIIMNFFDNLA